MSFLKDIIKIVFPRGFSDEESSQIAVIQYSISVATLIGVCLDLLFRFSLGGSRLIMPMLTVCLVVTLSMIMTRRGSLGWSGNLLLWTLLGFLIYLSWMNDGVHDTAILGFPAALAGAGLVLKKKNFFAFTFAALGSIAFLGLAEIHGVVHNVYSGRTNYGDIIDLMVILGITTVTMRLLADSFLKSLSQSRRDGMEIRKQAEKLRESEERYRTLFDAAHDAIFILRDGIFVECNTTALVMLGCEDTSEVVGRGPWDFSPERQADGKDSRAKAQEIIANALKGTPQRFFWRHMRSAGLLFDAEVSLNRLDLGGDALVQAIVRDVTENKEMENRLRESEEYYRKLVNTSPDAIIIVDTAGHLSFASQKAYEMFDVPTDQSVAGSPVIRWVAPEAVEPVKARLRDFFSGQLKSYAQEYRLLKQDGSTFWGEITSSPLNDGSGQVAGILMICRDVSERRNAADALRESEERFSRLSNAAFESIVMSENGYVVDLNEQFAAMLGYNQEEMIGLHVTKFVASGSLNLVLEHIQTESEEPYEHLAVRRDGSVFPVEVRAKSLPYHGRRIRVTAIRDITERRQAEDSLRTSEQKYRALFESANDAMFIFDPISEIIFEANSKACEIYGFSSEEFTGLSFKNITMNPARGEIEIRRALESGSLKNYETVHFKKDGTAAHFLVNASVIDYKGSKAIMSINRDITDLKRSEELLRLQSAALQTAGNAIVITDRSGAITYVNSAFSSLTGYSAEEALGKNPKILKSGIQGTEFYTKLWSTINSGAVWNGELTNKRKDGSLYTEEMTIAPVQNEKAEITHYIAIKNDISERKRLQEQLIQAQKMEAIGTLAGGIAHDFNNILGIILAHLSLMMGASSEPMTISTSAETITKAVQRGANLVRQILTFARKTDVDHEPIDINGLVAEVTNMLHGTFPKTIEIMKVLDDSLPLVFGDRTQLVQAMLNLCINSRDAMEEGSGSKLGSGRLTLRTGKISGYNLRLQFAEATASEYISLAISDTGCGFDPETKKKIFEPFFTTKRDGKGTGLGLAVVYGVVKAHQGFVDVESEPGTGSTFALYIPTSPDIIEHETSATVETETDFSGSETVMVVEDEPGLREFLVTVLQENGYKVLAACDGAEAIEQFERHSETISLVLSDMGLPKMDGEEVFSAIKMKNPHVRVVLASGYLEPQFKSDLAKAGVNDFLPKPYSIDQVLRKVREVLDAAA
jgi:PAS domain S-box-containing protein